MQSSPTLYRLYIRPCRRPCRRRRSSRSSSSRVGEGGGGRKARTLTCTYTVTLGECSGEAPPDPWEKREKKRKDSAE